MLKNRLFGVILIIILLPTVAMASPSFARVSKLEGDLLILRPHGEDWEYASINDIVEEGCILQTSENSYARLETEKGILIFIDENTKIKVETLDKDHDDREYDAIFEVIKGRLIGKVQKRIGWDVYLSLKNPITEAILPEGSGAEVKTFRSGTFYIKDIKGKIQLRTPNDVTYIDRGEIVQVDPEGYIAFRSSFSEWVEDDFETWCYSSFKAPPPPPYLPPEVDVVYYDLDDYGEWIFVPTYGYVWRPFVHGHWRPYYYGHWTFSISFGWVWVSYEPWGWIPYHYGRWEYVPGYGWVWIPGTVWGPGWVVWTWGPDWVGWCPMGYYGGPVTGVDFYIWTIVDVRTFRAPRYRYKPPRRPGPDPFYRYKKPRHYPKPKWETVQPPLVPKGVKVSMISPKREVDHTPIIRGKVPKRAKTEIVKGKFWPERRYGDKVDNSKLGNKSAKPLLENRGKRGESRLPKYNERSKTDRHRETERVFPREKTRLKEERVKPKPIEERKLEGTIIGNLIQSITGRDGKRRNARNSKKRTHRARSDRKKRGKIHFSLDKIRKFLK